MLEFAGLVQCCNNLSLTRPMLQSAKLDHTATLKYSDIHAISSFQ